MIKLTLPYPPSGNHAVRHARGGRHYVAEETRRYQEYVAHVVRLSGAQAGLEGRLGVECEISPPDKRRRDLDNAWKVLADAMTRAGVWKDDSQIDMLLLQRMPPVAGGSVVVCIRLW